MKNIFAITNKQQDLFKNNEFAGLSITFINMPLREAARPNVPPEGPGLLAAISERYGATAHIIDLNGYRVVDADSEKRGLPNGRHLTYQEAEDLFLKTAASNDDLILELFSLIIALSNDPTPGSIK